MLCYAGVLGGIDWGQFAFYSIPGESLLFLLLALFISVAGFYRVVYFVSLGYAFSVTGMALVSAYLFRSHLTLVFGLQIVALAIYGVRLGSYLIQREFQPSFRQELTEIHERTKGMAVSRKVLIWIGVSLLYVWMFSPGLFSLASLREGTLPNMLVWPWVGVVVMFWGLVLESLADWQKSRFKQQHPRRFCDVGLYRWVRCPNYFGEILFWVGNWITGMVSYHHALRWVFASLGLVCIILIMMGSTKRLEHKQDERYGELAEYQTYIRTVPVLFPFIPLYSLKRIRVYLE